MRRRRAKEAARGVGASEGKAVSGLGEATGRRLEARAGRRRRIWFEDYGPDGEIVRAVEGAEVPEGSIELYIVSQHGYAEPKTDWRERGVIPPKGLYYAKEGGEPPGESES